MEVHGQLHAPAALSPGKEPHVPNGREIESAQQIRNPVQSEKLVLPGIHLRPFNPISRHYTV
jgi:hypothetical protein